MARGNGKLVELVAEVEKSFEELDSWVTCGEIVVINPGCQRESRVASECRMAAA
jgi:hypothetical protein